MTVLIREGRIAAVQRGAAVPGGTQELDGRGKFLIPGLWDMHVHLSWTTASALPVLLANGVTGVRDVGSDLGEIDGWRTRIAAGLLSGPRIFRAGPILNGKSFNKYQLETGDSSQARGIVRALKWVGVDFIKVHRRTPRESYFAIIDEARKQGLAVVGHVPMTVTPAEASDAGQQIEHAYTLFEGAMLAGQDESKVPDVMRRFLANGAQADSLFARFVRNHTVVDATLVPYHEAADSSFPSDPHMRYVARSLREAVLAVPLAGGGVKQVPMNSAEEIATWRRVYAGLREVVGRMHRAGVVLLAGTDIAGPRPPGFTLHEELALLVDAGLTPLQALQTATLNPAVALKRESDFGRVAPGTVADLVLLDANPLADIRNTQRIGGVVVGGKLLNRDALDQLLRSGEELAGKN